jgi:hypothetical protein
VARDVDAVEALDPYSPAVETSCGACVVAEDTAGRDLRRSRGGDLEVEALDTAEGFARRDLEAVAAALTGAGREQPIAAAADVGQPRAVFEGARARREQSADDAGALGLVGEVDQVADARTERKGVGGVDVLNAVDVSPGPTRGQRRARGLTAGVGRNTSSVNASSWELCRAATRIS